MAITTYGRRETLVDGWIDELNGAIDASTTTITVADGSALPTVGPYMIQIDSEYIEILSRSGNVLTASGRGDDGSTAAAHSDAAEVRAVMTNEQFQRWLLAGHGVAYDGNSGGLAPYRMLDEDNNVLTASDFTWWNQGGASITDSGDGLLMQLPNQPSVYDVDLSSATAGTFTLTHDGNTTSGIAYNATAAAVTSALEGLASIGTGEVGTTLSSGVYTITFANALSYNRQALTADFTGITGGGSISETHNHVFRGMYLPVPASTPWRLHCQLQLQGGSYGGDGFGSHFGLMFLDNSANEMVTMTARHQERVWMASWTSVNTQASFSAFIDGGGSANSHMGSYYPGDELFFRIIKDGAGEIQAYVGNDGNNWSRSLNQCWQITETSGFPSGGTTENVGFYANSAMGLPNLQLAVKNFILEEI